MHVRRLGCLMVATLAIGCGGGGDGGPNEPPPPGGNNQTLDRITTSVSTMNIDAGTTSPITVVAYATDNSIISNPGSPTFTSSSSTIAEVDNSGNVFGVSAGTATVNVSLTRGGVTKTASVTVNVSGSLPLNAAVDASPAAYFLPGSVIIGRGGSVAWTFGSLEHTVTFANTAGAPSSITSGGYLTTISRAFNSAGNFNYQCSIHAGMSGTVIVR